MTYDKKRKEYNGALRLKGKQTTINYSYVDQILPDGTTATTAYTAPTLDTIPWQPAAYGGPEIKTSDAVDIDVGFGSPTTYMYTLKDGQSIDSEYRSFGSMGVTNHTGPYGIRLDSTSSGARFATCEADRYSYMAITLLPVASYVQSSNSEVFNLTVGAYDWRADTYLTAPA